MAATAPHTSTSSSVSLPASARLLPSSFSSALAHSYENTSSSSSLSPPSSSSSSSSSVSPCSCSLASSSPFATCCSSLSSYSSSPPSSSSSPSASASSATCSSSRLPTSPSPSLSSASSSSSSSPVSNTDTNANTQTSACTGGSSSSAASNAIGNIISKGIDLIKAAVEADNAGDYQKALDQYKRGMEYLMIAMKYEKNPKRKQLIREKISSYLSRAERIKKVLDERTKWAQNTHRLLCDDLMLPLPSPIIDRILSFATIGSYTPPTIDKSLVMSADQNAAQFCSKVATEDQKETFMLVMRHVLEDCLYPMGFARDLIGSVLEYARPMVLADELVLTWPRVQWDEIIGLETPIEQLKEGIILPLKFPHLFNGCRSPPRGILLFGHTGCGKTLLVNALANDLTAAHLTVLNISCPSIIRKGEPELSIKQAFEYASAHMPAVVCLDEIDDLCTHYIDGESDMMRRVQTELLVQISERYENGTYKQAPYVIGVTSRPFDLSHAVRRRFVKRIFVGLPSPETRAALIRRMLKTMCGVFDMPATSNNNKNNNSNNINNIGNNNNNNDSNININSTDKNSSSTCRSMLTEEKKQDSSRQISSVPTIYTNQPTNGVISADLSDADIAYLAQRTTGFSCADIVELMRQTLMNALREVPQIRQALLLSEARDMAGNNGSTSSSSFSSSSPSSSSYSSSAAASSSSSCSPASTTSSGTTPSSSSLSTPCSSSPVPSSNSETVTVSLTRACVERVLAQGTCRPSVSEQEVQRMQAWIDEFA